MDLQTVCTVCACLYYNVYILHIQNLHPSCVYILGEAESDRSGEAMGVCTCAGVHVDCGVSQPEKQTGRGCWRKPGDTLEHPVHQPAWVNTIHSFRWSIAL